MNETVHLILCSEFDCSVSMRDTAFDLQRLGKPKVFELSDLNSLTLQVFPLQQGLPFALKLLFEPFASTQSEHATVFQVQHTCYVLLHQPERLTHQTSAKQTELTWNNEKGILSHYGFGSSSQFLLVTNGQNITATLPFLATNHFSFPFGKACAIVCESQSQKALLLTDGKSPEMEVFLADLIGYNETTIQLYSSQRSLCKHAMLTLVSNNNGVLSSESKLVFEHGTPNYAFSEHLVPMAMLECIQLGDVRTAQTFCTLPMQKHLDGNMLTTFLHDCTVIIALPSANQTFYYGIVKANQPPQVLEVEMLQGKVNQVYIVA